MAESASRWPISNTGCVLRLVPSIRHDVRYAHCKVSVSECLKLDLVVVVDQQHNLNLRATTVVEAESLNAVCLNSLGHDCDSPNTVSSDAAYTKCPCETDFRSKRINGGRINKPRGSDLGVRWPSRLVATAAPGSHGRPRHRRRT